MSERVKKGPNVTENDFGPKAGRPGDDDGEGKKSKKEKKPKTEKSNEPKEKQRTHPFIVFVLTFLFCVILVVAALLALYNDVMGIKAPFNEFFNQTPLAEDVRDSIFRDREAVLQRWDDTLTDWEERLGWREADMDVREFEYRLDYEEFMRLRELEEIEDERRAWEIALLEDLLAAKLSVDDMVNTIRRMEAEEAAGILADMTNYPMALVIFAGQRSAFQAEILTAMPNEIAVRFIEDTVQMD